MIKDKQYYADLAPSFFLKELIDSFREGIGHEMVQKIEVDNVQFKEILMYKDVYQDSVAKILLDNGYCQMVKKLYDLDYGVNFLKSEHSQYSFNKCMLMAIRDSDLKDYTDIETKDNNIFLEIKDLMLYCGAITVDKPIFNMYIDSLLSAMSTLVEKNNNDYHLNGLFYNNLGDVEKLNDEIINVKVDGFIDCIKWLLKNKLIGVNELSFSMGFRNSISVFNVIVNYVIDIGITKDFKEDNSVIKPNVNQFIHHKLGFLKEYVNPDILYKNIKEHQYVAHKGSSDWADGIYNEYTHHLFTDFGFMAGFEHDEMADVIIASDLIVQLVQEFPWLIEHKIAYNKKSEAHILEALVLNDGLRDGISDNKSINQIVVNGLLMCLLDEEIQPNNVVFKNNNYLHTLKEVLERKEEKNEVLIKIFSLFERSDLNDVMTKSTIKSKALRF